MLKFPYPKIVVEKARALIRVANKEGANQAVREEICRTRFGLSYRYMQRIGTIHKTPSNRTLMELGYEVVVRDKVTGAEEVVDLKDGRL
jgi:hypothetical protein